MSFLSARCLPGTALVLSLAHAAHADVTAQDVWSNWQSYMQGLGYEVSASETRSGATLTISDLILTNPNAQDTGAITLKLSQIGFTENDDGTVEVVFPQVTPFDVTVVGEEGSTADVALEIRQKDLTSTISGVPTEMTNTYTAETIEIVLTGLTVDDEVQNTENASFSLKTQDISGTVKSTVGGKRVYEQDMQASGVSFDLAFKDPTGGDARMDGQLADLELTGSSSLPLVQIDAGDLSALLSAGFASTGTFSYSAGASNTTINDNSSGTFSAATTSAGGTLNAAFGKDGLDYSGDQKALNVTMALPDFPVPITFDVAQASFNMAMPLQKSEEAGDFALGFSFNEFSMSDMLWGLFDPGAKLPRDPATVVMDLTGKARLLFDFLDPTAAGLSANPAMTPAEVETLDVNKVQISVAGAELNGDGAFRFDNSVPGGTPKPIGGANLSLMGGNKLLDTLVEMGLLPQEQAMGARMMMGLLAVPGEAPDTLNSRIEINEQGHVMANGQRIQ